MDAEAGDDLIDDQECTMFAGNVAQARKKTRLGKNNTHVSGNGLDDDGCDLVFVLRRTIARPRVGRCTAR